MDPWETFQARKAADKITRTEGKLRHSTRGTDQLLDPWERFQALKAADRLTAMEGKLRQNRRGADQLNLDFQRPKAREDVRMSSTQNDSQRRPFPDSRRPVGTPDHINSNGYIRVYQPRTMQTENRRLSTLHYSGNFAGETGLHTLQQQRLRVLQPLNGSRGPFSEVEDWFAAKYITRPKQELYKSIARGPFSEVDDWFTAKYITGQKQELYKFSAQQKTTTQGIAGVHTSSYGAQDVTGSSSTVTLTESMDVESTDDISSDVSEISCRFNGIDLNGLSEDSNSTITNRKKAWNIGLNPEKPQKSTTLHPLYSSTGPNSGGYRGKSQSRNVTVSHILAAKQKSPCVQKYTDDLTANKVTNTVPDKSLKSVEHHKISTEGDVDEHPSSPAVRNNIDDLLSLTKPMPARATDDTSSYVPKLINMYPLDSSGLDELSDDCESIITETVDIPKSETKALSTIDKMLNIVEYKDSEKMNGTTKSEHLVGRDNLDELSEDCDSIITETVDIPKSETKELSTIDRISNVDEYNANEKTEGTAKSEHLVGTDNPDIINSCTFKDDVKPTEQESIDSGVSQATQQIEDALKDISAPVSDIKRHGTESEILIIEKKTTEQVVITPEISETKKDTSGCEKCTQTNQNHLQHREVKEEVETEVVPRELTRSSDNAALSETSTKDNRDGCPIYPRHVLYKDVGGLVKEPEPQQASGEISTLCELNKLKDHKEDDQSNRPTDRSNANMFDEVKEDMKDAGSSMYIEKKQTTRTDDQKVKDMEKKDRQEEEERKNRDILETEEALRQEETKLAYERTETHLREFQKTLEQITANEKAKDKENMDRQEKEEGKERIILEIEEALKQDDTELAYEKIDKHLKEFQKKLEEKYVGSRSDNSFIRGGNINVTIQCGVLTSEYLNPPPVTQPVPSENNTSAYIDGHENYPNGECSQTGSRIDIRAQKQTKHIKQCKNCGSTRLDTVCKSSSLISVTSVSQSSPRFLIDSMQGDQCDDHDKVRERILVSPVQAEQATAHDKARIVNNKRIHMQRELQQRKSKPLPTIRLEEASPFDIDRVKRRHSRKARNEGSPITAQSPPSRSTDKSQTDTESKKENRVKRNILKPKRSEDKYRVGSENKACSEKPQIETVKTLHSKREKSKDDFTDIFATETDEYQCPSSDKTKESSSIPKDKKINEASSLRPTSSDGTDTTVSESSTDLSCVSTKSPTKYKPKESETEKDDNEVYRTCNKSPELEKQNTKSGRKNVHPTKRNREASPKTQKDRSSTPSESDDSTDSDQKSNRRKSGKSKSRLKRSTRPIRTRQHETSPKAHTDRSSSTSSESDDSTDSDQKSNRRKSGKSKSRLKRSTRLIRTRQHETSPKAHTDRSSSTSSESDDSTDSDQKSNRRKSGKSKSRLKRSTGHTKTRKKETCPKSHRDRSSSTSSESDDSTDSDQKSNRGKSGKSKSRLKRSTGHTKTRKQETYPKSHRDRSSSTFSESDDSTDSDLNSKRERNEKSGSKVKLQGKQSTGPTKTSGNTMSFPDGRSSNGKRRIQSKQKSKRPVSKSSEVAVNESVASRENENSDNSSAHISNDNIVVKKKGQDKNIKSKNRRLERPSKTNTEDDATSETKCCLSSSVPEKQSSNENGTDSMIEKTKSRKHRDAKTTSGKRKVRPEYGEETSHITDDSSTAEWSDSLQSENNISNSQSSELYTTKIQPDSRTSETLKKSRRKTTADSDKTSAVRKASESENKKDRESKRESKDLSEMTSNSTFELTDQNKSDREAKQTQDSKQRSIPSCRIDALQDSDSWLSSTNTTIYSISNEVQAEEEQKSSGHGASTNVQGNGDDTVGSSLSTTDTYSDSEIEDNEGDEKKENEHTKVDKIKQKEKRKDEIAELKKRLEEVKRIDKAQKHSQETQKKEQKTMEKLDKELDKKKKEIEKVNLKKEQRQIKNEKDEEKNALKEEKRLQKMQMKQEKEEQSKIKKEAKKAENEEKKLEKLRKEIKKVEEKQASKIVKTEEGNTDENDDDNDDKCNGGDHIVNDNASDSDAIFDDDSEDDVSGKVEVKNKITEMKEKLEEAKRLEKAEKRTRESQKKDEKAKKKLDEKHEQEKKKQEKVAHKKEQQQLKDEKDNVKKLLKEKKKFLEKQLKQKKKEQTKIQKEAKKAAKDAEKQRKKSAKTQKDVQKKEQKRALKKEPKHDDDDEMDDDENEVNGSDSDRENNDEVDDGQNQPAESDKMNENVEIIQNEIAAIKEELEDVKMIEEAEKHQSKSDEKNEKAIEKLDKEMEREKKKMEEMDRKLELKQKKIEKDEEKKMLKEEKKIFEKLMKEEKKEQSRITKEAKKAEKEKEKGKKKVEKEVEKERKKAEKEKEKQRKKAEKEQKDAQKKEEKEAKKAAEKEQKEAAKVVKKREKEQKEKEKRDKMYKKKEQQKEKKLEKKKQKEESKLLAFRRKKEMERQSRMKKAEEQREKEEMKRKTAEKEAAQKEEIKQIKNKRKKEKKRWKLIEKRDKFVLKQEKEEYEQREREKILLRFRNGLNNANLSLSEDSQDEDEITKDESSPDTSSSDSRHEITKKESSPVKSSSVIPTEDCENEYMEIFQSCASNQSDSPCAPDSFGHLTVRDHDDIDDEAVRSRQYQMKEKKINLVVEFQKYLARKARSQKSEESNNTVSNQSPSGNTDTNNEQVLSFPPCTGSQHKTDAKEKSDVPQNSQPPEQLEEQTLPCRWIDKTERPNHHSLNADLPKSTQNASLKPDAVKPVGDNDDEKRSHIGSSNKSKTPEEIQSCATGDKSHTKEAGAKSAGNLSSSKSMKKVNRTQEALKPVRTGKDEGKGAHGNMIKSDKDTDDQTGTGYHSWDDSDEEIDVQKKTSAMNVDQRRGIEVEFVPEYSYNSWDDTDEETEVEKKPSIMKLNEMKGIDVEFVPEYSYNSWDDTDDEDTIEREIKDVMGENLDIYEPKPTPPVEEKEPDILADPILKELYGDEYEDVCGGKEKKVMERN